MCRYLYLTATIRGKNADPVQRAHEPWTLEQRSAVDKPKMTRPADCDPYPGSLGNDRKWSGYCRRSFFPPRPYRSPSDDVRIYRNDAGTRGDHSPPRSQSPLRWTFGRCSARPQNSRFRRRSLLQSIRSLKIPDCQVGAALPSRGVAGLRDRSSCPRTTPQRTRVRCSCAWRRCAASGGPGCGHRPQPSHH